MLLQLLANHPEAIVPIVRNTPAWVWGLLAGLMALGASQLRDRTAGLARVSLMPVGMTAFSVWGTYSALGASHHLAGAVLAWFVAAAIAFAFIASGRAAAQFDPATRMYRMPGSVQPLLLIAGIFLVKYAVGIELAMAPQRVQEGEFALVVATLYGVFNGIFVGRAARLWRLALRPQGQGMAA
ncbi:MAG TPA: DUF6622 family protein [Ramlibacter sp.]|nr:DUF6622 family protein [Ramlibacter sp.]